LSRSRWKFNFVKDFLIKNTIIKKLSKSKKIKKNFIITNKSTSLPKLLLFSYLTIHKGNSFMNKRVNRWMLGKKIGEFVFTRKPFFFPVKVKNKR